MNESPLEPGREAALIRLLDDPSPAVKAALMREFGELGEPGILALRRAARASDRGTAEAAVRLLRELGGEDTVHAFIEFIRSFNYELETGAMMIDRTVFPRMGPGKYCLFFDKVAERCKELLVLPSSGWERCKVLNRVVFHEYGFRGDLENFFDPRNSFLHEVIDRRRGIPIALSIVYLLVAYRCGLELRPVALPGRFMAGCFLDREPFYIDVFERGVFRSEDDVRRLLASHGFPHISDSQLMPASTGEVLCRCCRNLHEQYARAGNEELAGRFQRFVDEFDEVYRRNARP